MTELRELERVRDYSVTAMTKQKCFYGYASIQQVLRRQRFQSEMKRHNRFPPKKKVPVDIAFPLKPWQPGSKLNEVHGHNAAVFSFFFFTEAEIQY